jgi:ArsR family transcriptional regulator
MARLGGTRKLGRGGARGTAGAAAPERGGEGLSFEAALVSLRAAGESTRLRILNLLRFGEVNVTDLTLILGQSQPRISRHLKLLGEAGLIRRFREGNWVFCRLADGGPGGELARAILDRLAEDEPALAGDRERLVAIKAARAAEAERFFNQAAGEWDRIRAYQIGEAEVERALLGLIGEARFARAIDLGTGTGRMLELFAARIDRGIGVDSSQSMLAYARARLERAGLAHCQVRHGDITRLAYEPGSADLVILHQVLHYFDDPQPVLDEAARLLAPGGTFLIVDFAPHGLEFLRAEHAHRRLGFAADQIAAALAKAGLRLVGATDLERAGALGGEGLKVSIWHARKCADGGAAGGAVAGPAPGPAPAGDRPRRRRG